MHAALLVLVLAAAPAAQEPAPADTSDAPLTLEEAVALARAYSPALTAARLQQDIDRARVGVAREFPNPDLRYEREKEAPHDSLGASQVVELPGKRGRRIAAAQAALATGSARLVQAEAEARAEAARAFYTVASAQRQAVLAREIRDLADRAREAAAFRLEVGDVSRLDLLQAELALAQAENEEAAAAGTLRAGRATLNTFVGRDPARPTVVQDALDAAPPADPALLAAAAAQGASVAVFDREIAQARADLALARAERFADPTVEGTVTHDAPGEFRWGWRAAVTVTLPLWTRHTAAVQVQEATLRQLQEQRAATVGRARGAVYAAAVKAAAGREQYLRYRDSILPRSREVEAMAEDSYREGQTDLPALLQALQAARELRQKSLQAAADYQSALADLEQARAVGTAP